MTIHYSNWHNCLISLAFALAATSVPASAFSSRSKRPIKRGRGGSASSFASTRRVFCFTLAGGAHTMFSGIRTHDAPSHSSSSAVGKRPRSSTSALKYRVNDYDDDEAVWDYCNDMVDESSSSYTDSLWQAALRPTQEVRQVSISNDSGVVALLHIGESTNALPELLPISSFPSKMHEEKGSSSIDGLVETAKAFIPVAVEIGVVAVAAANVSQMN